MISLCACILSGALLVLAYPKPDLGFVAWFALAPLVWAVAREERPTRAAAIAFAGGWTFYAGLMYWIYFTCRAGGLAAPLAVGAWLGLAMILALDWGLFGLAVALLRRMHGFVSPGLAAVVWVGVEYLRARWTTQFPWGLLGYTQWREPVLLQITSATGVYGLSFVLMLVNAALGLVFAPAASRSRGVLRLAGLCLAPMAAVAATIGIGRFALARVPKPTESIEVGFLQPNIDQYKKWDGNYKAEIRGVLESMADAINPAPALIVWPEAAVPGWIDDPDDAKWVSGLVKRTRSFNVIGALARGDSEKGYNATFVFAPDGAVLGSYRKRQLVPFGEYVPMAPYIGKWVQSLSPVGEIDRGAPDQEPVKTLVGALAMSVCYEAIFPHLMRSPAQDGARLLVNVTNDGWYLDTAGPYQHFAMAVLRAPENRAYLLRAGNTGISALIDPYGRVVAASPLNRRTVLRARLELSRASLLSPPYAQIGDMFAGLCLGGAVMLLFAGLLPRSWRES